MAEFLNFRDALRSDRDVRAIIVTAIANSLGTGMFMSGSILYFTRHLKFDADSVGVTLTLCSFAALIVTLPFSVWLERFGLKKSLILLHAFRSVGYSAYIFVHSFVGFVALSLVLTIADRSASPASQGILAAVIPKDSRMQIMAWRHSANNAGIGVGALLAAAMMSAGAWGFSAIMIGNGLSFLIAAILVGQLTVPQGAKPKVKKRANLRAEGWPGQVYLWLTLLSALFLLFDVVITVAMPLWVVGKTQAPSGAVGLLMATNTVVIVVCQPRLSRLVSDNRSAARALFLSGVLLAAGCLLIGASAGHALWLAMCLLFTGILILTVGEAIFVAGSWWLSIELAPEAQRSRYLAVYSMGATAERVIGPTLATFVIVGFGIGGWIAVAALFVCCAVASLGFSQLSERVSDVQDPMPAV